MKQIKISLGTAICIFIIIVLIIGLIFVYLDNVKLKKEQNSKTYKEIEYSDYKEKANNINVDEEQINNKYEEVEHSNSKEENNSIDLNDKKFIISNIEKKTNKYEVTVNILEKTAKKVTKEEYNKILNGGKITFRGLDWQKYKNQGNNTMYIESGKYKLAIIYNQETNDYIFENVAGAVSGGLADYSGETVKFEIKDLDGIIPEGYNNSIDSYSECVAETNNGEVTNIKFVISEYR